ncbi:M23 family metallopeptidase [Paenibacillus validus]|uniref:M23 family metallopeptidase n=1 Tax=Paenibacillus validus TaxID=44253 RepID=UPI003D2B98CE
MWVTLAKLAVKLIPPDKAIKVILGAVFVALIFLILLFAGPIMVFKHIPLGKTTSEFNFYTKAAQKIEQDTGVLIGWQKIMAIDAVLLDQEFAGSSESRAYGYKKYFIREEQKKIEKTCSRTVTKKDKDGNEYEDSEDYDCSYWITVYYERNYDDVLNMLVADGKLPADKIEDVKRYNIYDASPLAVDVGDALPPGWMPTIRDFAWPTENVFTVTSLFGPRTDPIEFVTTVHNGLDIGAATGTPVLAVKDGKVIYAKYMGNAGNTVIIQHDNDTETRYYHLSKITVKAGDKVKQKDKVGEVGSTGRSTGPHLHMEVRIAANPVDPLQYYR